MCGIKHPFIYIFHSIDNQVRIYIIIVLEEFVRLVERDISGSTSFKALGLRP